MEGSSRCKIVEYGEAGEHVLEPLSPGIWMLSMSVAANDRCPAGQGVIDVLEATHVVEGKRVHVERGCFDRAECKADVQIGKARFTLMMLPLQLCQIQCRVYSSKRSTSGTWPVGLDSNR